MISSERLSAIAHWSLELTESERERARRGVIEKSFGAGAFICHQGDRYDSWAGVIEGLVQLSTFSDSGHTVTLAGLAPGQWFGEGSVLKSEKRRYDLIALRQTRLALMDLTTFFWLFDNSVGFNRFLVRQFNERLSQFMGLVEHDRMATAPARVARALSLLFNPMLNPRHEAVLAITQEEIGQLSGLSRQVTNAALKTLETAGLVQAERGKIHLRNWQGLKDFVEGG